MYTNPLTWESAPEGPNLLVGSGRSDWKLVRAQQVALFPIEPLPNIQHHNIPIWVVPPWWIPRLHPYNVTFVPRQKNMAQMKEQIKPPVKELSGEETGNPSDAEFKTLVIRMLTKMTEYSCKIKDKVKAMQSEIKENV